MAADVAATGFYLKAAAALVGVVFGTVLLAGAPRRAPSFFLSAFLFLIAANQAVEAVRVRVVDPEVDVTLWRLATVFASFDPVALYAFAAVFPGRNALARPALMWGVFGVAAALALTAPVASLAGPALSFSTAREVALAAFTFAVYFVVLARFLLMLPERHGDARARLVILGLSLAAFPVLIRLQPAVRGFLGLAIPWPGDVVVDVALGGLALAIVGGWGLRRLDGPDRRVVAVALAAGAALTVVLMLPYVIQFALPEVALSIAVVGQAGAAIRWMLFSIFVSVAIVRHDLLGMSLAARRRAARVLVALVFLGVLAVLLAATTAATGQDLGLSPVVALLILATLVASQGFQSVTDRVASRVYGVPVPGNFALNLDAYRDAVAQARAESRSLETDPALERLREELGLDARTAGVIRRMAEAEAAGPTSPGMTVSGRYKVVRLIGRGGSGRAFLARDELLLRDVVLKEVPHEDDASEAAVLREARAAGTLAHANIVTVHDVIRRGDASLIVTEYVAGGSLEDRVREFGRLTVAQGVDLADGVLSALEAIHARGIVHRDLKPANVLLNADASPKLTDFGIARLYRKATVRFEEGALFAGTPDYMAPEQRRGEPTTPAADLYALGRLLQATVEEPLPPALAHVVERALAESPVDRWSTAAEMRLALRRAAASPLTVARPTEKAPGT